MSRFSPALSRQPDAVVTAEMKGMRFGGNARVTRHLQGIAMHVHRNSQACQLSRQGGSKELLRFYQEYLKIIGVIWCVSNSTRATAVSRCRSRVFMTGAITHTDVHDNMSKQNTPSVSTDVLQFSGLRGLRRRFRKRCYLTEQ